MKIINVSEGKENYSQRNNKIAPLESCNCTSVVMALDYLGYVFPSGDYEQPEDNLQAFLLKNKLEKTNHYDLMKGYNLWMGQEVGKFSTANRFIDLVAELLIGKPWVASGTFPGYPNILKKALGHIVCVVGLVYESDPASPSEIIIDDPYGNTMKNWGGSGNDVHIPWDLFVKWFKPFGDGSIFWAHCFKKSDKFHI